MNAKTPPPESDEAKEIDNQNTPDEIDWKQIPDFPNYWVTKTGLVRSNKRTLKQYKNPYGYMVVGLHKDGKQYSKRVHRLVLSTFKPTDDPRLLALHIDGTRDNNNLSNLKWGDMVENYNDSRLHGTANKGERHGMAKLTVKKVARIRECLANGQSKHSLAREYGVSQKLIILIARNEIWT